VAAKYLNPETLSVPPGGMHSQIVRVRASETLYISGQLARDAAGKLHGEGDVVAQYRKVWSNIGLALEAVGLRYEHLVSTTTYVVGEANVPAIRAVRKELAPPLAPTSTMVVVVALAVPGALVEVEAVAAFPE
jgi:enamine deaminase RidA (YjgF/YER057c/UK114 family)